MITLEHVALYFMGGINKVGLDDMPAWLSKGIPWLLLPDAIRAYTGHRQPSHFEQSPDKTDVSWMVFPTPEVLKEMTKNSAAAMVDFHLAKNTPPCVVGEETQLDVFDEKNYSNPHFHDLRIHMIQDCILDMTIRDEIDVTGRFDDKFVVCHNTRTVLNGKELRERIKAFEELGFLHLVGKVYQQSGVLLNQQWFDQNVHSALLSAYPEDLAEKTYSFMRIPDFAERRINQLDFTIRDEECEMVEISDDLVKTFDRMYSLAYLHTSREL